MKTVKKIIIRMLGGHTDSEYQRLKQKYDALMMDRSDNGAAVKMVNEYQYRLLSDLDQYMKSLWNNPTDIWAYNTYKVVHDNLMYLVMNMPQGKLQTPYKMKMNPFAMSPKDLAPDYDAVAENVL